jgi:hypothetical protein
VQRLLLLVLHCLRACFPVGLEVADEMEAHCLQHPFLLLRLLLMVLLLSSPAPAPAAAGAACATCCPTDAPCCCAAGCNNCATGVLGTETGTTAGGAGP